MKKMKEKNTVGFQLKTKSNGMNFKRNEPRDDEENGERGERRKEYFQPFFYSNLFF